MLFLKVRENRWSQRAAVAVGYDGLYYIRILVLLHKGEVERKTHLIVVTDAER
uniref:Uncharacterized protein n=1 Tax=Moniliophthora roreri TaxID=221103 RepID=A0A0W0F7A7_MONRR